MVARSMRWGAMDELPAHGGLRDAELQRLGLDPARVADFSVSINPYGPGPAIRAAIEGAPIGRYPDPRGGAAREALAKHLGLPAERLALGHGATELLWTLVRALIGPGESALGVVPAFSEIAGAVRAHRARWHEYRMEALRPLAFDAEDVARAARRARACLVYACAPTSPLGTAVPITVLIELAERIAPAVLVVDEAFLGLSEHAGDQRAAVPDNVVRVRSLTKELGTPGVRVGYAIATASVIEAIESARPAWTVSGHALAAMQAYAQQPAFLEQVRQRLLADRRPLDAVLTKRCAQVFPTSTIYRCARPGVPVSELRWRLLRDHAILVRDCASFGLPDLIRFGVRPAGDVARLDRALAELLA